jgi:hypothetical protein
VNLKSWKEADVKPTKKLIRCILADWDWRERILLSRNAYLEEKVKRLRRRLKMYTGTDE